MVTLAAAFVHAVACNGILGNDDKTLDERPTFPEASTLTDSGRSDGPQESSTCGADLTGDRKNCGACGHDCMAGACTAGKCQPFVLATGQTTPSSLVVDKDVAYWTTGDGTVQSCPLSGCNNTSKKITQIDAGNPAPAGLAVRDGTVYVVGYYSQAVHTCPVAGCASPTTLVGGIPSPHDIVVDATNAYFLSASAPYLARCPLPSCAGGAVKVVNGTLPAWYGIVADDTTLYWYGGGPTAQFDSAIVYRAPKSQVDGGPEVLLSGRPLSADGPSKSNLAVKSGTLFVTEDGPKVDGGHGTAGVVYKMALAPGLARFPIASGQSQPRGIAVDDTHVYWVTQGDGAVQRCELAGCNLAPTILATGQNLPAGPVLTDRAVYWTEYLGGTVKGVAK